MAQCTRVKMCGMTRAGDIANAVTLGVDAIGLIFYQHSARHVTVEHAKIILKAVSVFVDVVAVFVNPSVSLVQRVITELPVHYLQFHGDESPEFCEQFAYPYIKAMHAISTDAINFLLGKHQQAMAILLDTPSATHHGGSGIPFDWRIIPQNTSMPIILAGGLHASNIGAAIRGCVPYAVDVCSGVEASPGIKDLKKMNQFVTALGRR